MTENLDLSALAGTRSPNVVEWLTGELDVQNIVARQQMAAANGFQYVPADKKFQKGPGSIFLEGEMLCLNIFSGSFVGLPFHLFHSPVGASSRYATIFRFTLPRQVPQLVIDSRLDGSIESILPQIFTPEQRVSLEGDFSKYFTTYAPKSYEQSMVNVLAPDIMQVLIRYAAHCDVEIIDNYMYFYWPYTLYSPQDVQKIFTTAHAVMYQLHDKLSRSDIYGTTEQKQIHATSKQGVHLKKKKKTIVDRIFEIGPWVIGVFLAFKPEYMPQFIQPYGILLLFVVIPFLFIYVTWDFLKKRRLKKELNYRSKF